ncbi:spermatogenesis-associated protein 31E1 isoform X1 [Fukomys damarensis]|uniref:spermatogenesis-associated protein 31E1 isoform X1 n=1 Tax=Fukomys damarensis TaxID=885580 RepID=UPI0014558128|nr:spermatogenesis-associated protein 31E1 isoform X1 [Fukomys damarensis]
MRPNSRITRTTLRVQLPEGNATSQTMKRFLLLLKILHETWMSPSSTTWATDVILASACGLAHLIPLIPHLRTNLAFLLTGKRNNRKHHRKKSRWNQSREQSRTQRTVKSQGMGDRNAGGGTVCACGTAGFEGGNASSNLGRTVLLSCSRRLFKMTFSLLCTK